MHSQIAKRKADLQRHILDKSFEDPDGFKDVFSMLVQANETEGKLKLDDSELVSGTGIVRICEVTDGTDKGIPQLGNVFAMLIAGHGMLAFHHLMIGSEHTVLLRCAETTAVTLVATLAFLASYQGVQEETFQHIIDVVGHDQEPVSISTSSDIRLPQ